jgi:hypothetical protein
MPTAAPDEGTKRITPSFITKIEAERKQTPEETAVICAQDADLFKHEDGRVEIWLPLVRKVLLYPRNEVCKVVLEKLYDAMKEVGRVNISLTEESEPMSIGRRPSSEAVVNAILWAVVQGTDLGFQDIPEGKKVEMEGEGENSNLHAVKDIARDVIKACTILYPTIQFALSLTTGKQQVLLGNITAKSGDQASSYPNAITVEIVSERGKLIEIVNPEGVLTREQRNTQATTKVHVRNSKGKMTRLEISAQSGDTTRTPKILSVAVDTDDRTKITLTQLPNAHPIEVKVKGEEAIKVMDGDDEIVQALRKLAKGLLENAHDYNQVYSEETAEQKRQRDKRIQRAEALREASKGIW